MHRAVNLSTAARAGAIVAAKDLNASPPASTATALADATAAVNAEEGLTGADQFGSGPGCHSRCVSLRTVTGPHSGLPFVDITISDDVTTVLPVVPGVVIESTAGASTG